MNTPPPLTPAVSGQRLEINSPAGRLSYYVDGSGPPLLLVHSVNAAATVAEVKPVYDHYKATRTVFALDLPGFGFSERSARAYTPALMVAAVEALLEVIEKRFGVLGVDAMGLSLACEFVARLAVQQPARIRSLSLVSPTGFSGGKSRRGAAGSTYAMPWFFAALTGPGWGRGLFNLLTRPGVVRYFLNKTWGSKNIDEDLCAYCVLTAQQDGAEHAPLCFLSGQMFSADIHTVYEALRQPVWVAHGVRGDFTDYRGLSLVQGKPNWQISVYQAGAIPYFELPHELFPALDRFLARSISG
ncbi:MAG: alpha/beta fold hydrolase [Rhodoferax sp.]|nr:alpha/beta fold hydrolase [Rhodoferax sp.]